MQKTNIIIALAALAAVTLAIVGLASAQINASQNYTNTTPNNVASNNGFWGWVSNCFGYGNNQVYMGQYVAPQAPPTDGSTQAPYQESYGYGYGPCWAR